MFALALRGKSTGQRSMTIGTAGVLVVQKTGIREKSTIMAS